jgi:hypothetical protein
VVSEALQLSPQASRHQGSTLDDEHTEPIHAAPYLTDSLAADRLAIR